MAFYKSIHGRSLGITSSRGLGQYVDSSGGGSTIQNFFQQWGSDHIESLTAGAATVKNSGVSIISSGTTNGSSMTMSAPVAGVYKEIHFQCSATAFTLQTSASTIYFNTTLAESAAGGSTTLSFAQATAGLGGCLAMRGLSATQWGIVSNTVGAST